MELVEDINSVRGALTDLGLLVIDADLPTDRMVHLHGDPAEVAESLTQIGAPVVFFEVLHGVRPEGLDDDNPSQTDLVAEYRERFEPMSSMCAIAAPVSGALVGAVFTVAAWAEFAERVSSGVNQPIVVTDDQINEWATLCAADDRFKKNGAQQRPGIAWDIIGHRYTWETAQVVEAAAMELLADTLGVEARAMRADGASKESIRVKLAVPGPLVALWLES